MKLTGERSSVTRRRLPGIGCWKSSRRTLGTTGIDLFVGRKTHRMFRAAGLIDIQVNPVIHVYPPGNNRRNILCDFLENVRDRILAERLITEAEFHERLAELKRHLDDAGTLVISNLFVQVWGRKLTETN